jgi:hypothetical protein
MSNRQYIGNVHFTEQPSSIQFREGAGWRRVRTWTGAKALLGQPGEFVLPDFACDVDVKYGPVQAEIQATYQLVDPTSFTWELIGNDYQVSIWEHPRMVTIMNALPSDDARVTLAAAILKASRQDPPTLPSKLDIGTTIVGAIKDEVKAFYTRLLLQQDSFYVSQYVLSKTILASSKSDQVSTQSEFLANHTDVLSIYTYAQLLVEEPTLIKGSGATGANAVWTNVFSETPIPDGTLEVYGSNLINLSGLGPAGQNLLWQKRTPKVQLMQRGMWQVSQEYWGAVNFDNWKYHYKGTPPWQFIPPAP